jgi:hypothetical protein
MESIKFTRLYDNNISSSIRELVEESSYLKSRVFKSIISGEIFKSNSSLDYKRFVSDFIESWTNYAEDLVEKMKTANGVAGISTVNYNFAKEYIYAKDDYASVLQFADGVVKGIKDNKFKDPDDVEDFFVFMVQKAFHEKGDSVASVLDSVLINGISVDMISNTSDYDAKMFDTVKKYQMFNSRDPKELNKAIDKVVDFLTDEMGDIIRDLKHNNMKMFVSMVNNIIEYITYSLTIYATRIYLISQYAYPFINGYKETVRPVSESVGEKTELGESDIAINVMHSASELLCRDYTKTKEFLNTFDAFIKSIGADPLFGVDKPKPCSYQFKTLLNDDNVFSSKLIGNALFEYITSFEMYPLDSNRNEWFTEMNHILKEYIYNNTHAIEVSHTPKHEILHVIRGAEYDKTVNGYQKLAKDLYVLTCNILNGISRYINHLENWIEVDHVTFNYNTSMINDVAENIKMLKDLYVEFATIFLHKARDIELEFNYLKKANIAKIENEISIKIPNQKSELDYDYNMMNAVPDTTRLPIDLMDLYDLPTFESLELYDDYLRSLPGMEDDSYLSEAVNISSIINAIFSRIKSVFNRFASFISDKKFEAARKWVIDHQNDILSLDYTGKEIYVLPYKQNVTLPAGYNNLIEKLKAFDEKNVESDVARTEFIKSLYPSEAIYNWFYGNETDKSGPEMYRNHILFYDLNEVKKEIPAAVAINGQTLHNALSNWITTMRQAPDTLNEFKRIKDQIETAVNGVKSKMVSIENTAKQKEMNDDKETNPPSMTSDKKEEGEAKPIEVPPTTKEGDNKSSATSGNEALLVEIQTTIMRLWGSLASTFIHYYLTEYKYIKDAYAVGRKSN